ncbi:MAG TPA: hypothetical protein VFZ95_08785 [Steroidobacteraceae bacterium]
MRKLSFSLLSLALLAAHAVAAMEQTQIQMLDGHALLERVVGNTIHFQAPSEDVYMYLAKDGTIFGDSTAHGKFLARWRLYERDSLCFQQQDPMASGCVAVSLRGSQITFHRRDGVIEGPFELLSGNPRKL